MVIKNLGWFVSAGLVVVLAWAMCSRPPELTEGQKRGLEAFGDFANPSEQSKRFVELRNNFFNRAMVDASTLSKAWEPLHTEFERRTKDGISEEAVAWYEAETSRTDAEIVARWGVQDSD